MSEEEKKVTSSSSPGGAIPALIEDAIKEIEEYLKYYNNQWVPHTDKCITGFADLEKEVLERKKSAKAGKIAGITFNVLSGILGTTWCALGFTEPTLVTEVAVGGGAAVSAIIGFFTQMGISISECNHDNKVKKQSDNMLLTHLETSKHLDEIITKFKDKYQLILDYLDQLGFNGALLQAYIRNENILTFSKLQESFQKHTTSVEKATNHKESQPAYGSFVSFLLKVVTYVKNIISLVYEKVSNIKISLAALSTAGITLPNFEGYDTKQALGTLSKVGLGIGIGLNLLAVASNIYDMTRVVTDVVELDEVYSMVTTAHEDIKKEKEYFEQHLQSIKKCKEDLEKVKEEVKNFKF